MNKHLQGGFNRWHQNDSTQSIYKKYGKMHMEETLRSADNTTEADYLKRKHIWLRFMPSCSTKYV